MEKNKNTFIYKNNKGSIVLYVLLMVMFFIFILVGIYVSNTNKIIAQNEQIKKIGENYNRYDTIEKLDELYKDQFPVANEPNLEGFNKSTTYYVKWNETSSPFPINDKYSLQTGYQPTDWYNYKAGVNHWANIKTTGGGNDCYWVWIPRYAYKVPERNVPSTIEVKFLEGTTNNPMDGSTITISNNTTVGSWNVSPAFWWDKNDNGIEDDGEQLSGIWVAKYEASSSSPTVVENPRIDQLAIDGGSASDTDLKVRVKPNVASWRNITVDSIVWNCLNIKAPGGSLENSTNIDSHMIKNSEWGAVAYLSRSIYGKNDIVWNNSFYTDMTTFSTITGVCGSSSNERTSNINNIHKYNTTAGVNASTTGNVYGVYDMAGGVWEYVAGFLQNNGATSSWNSVLPYIGKRYADVYSGNSTSSQENYSLTNTKFGDAIYETSTGETITSAWDSDYSNFITSSNPVLARGANAYDGTYAGFFAFSANSGNTSIMYGFRPAVVCLEEREE